MMIKKIPFGTDEGLLITDFSIKNKVLEYLYNSLNLSKHRFIMLNTVNKLEFLKETEHYVSPSFKGFNYFLIFMTNEVNILRADEVHHPITKEEALKNAPAKDSDYFRVPKFIEK
jgi:Asp-tRNA(Asn)/Glu-tRNA(Gln) amidotransferase C subunit